MAIINLFTFFAWPWPHTNYFTTTVLAIAKLYANTLLVLFNSRMRIIGGREEPSPPPQSTGSLPSDRHDLSQPQTSLRLVDTRRPSQYLQEYQKSSPLCDEQHRGVLEVFFLFFSVQSEVLTDPMCSDLREEKIIVRLPTFDPIPLRLLIVPLLSRRRSYHRGCPLTYVISRGGF